MAYRFALLPQAEKQLQSLDRDVARRILKKLQWIEKQIQPLRFAVLLRQTKIGDARFRIGDYRVITLMDEKKKTITIAAIGHRREIYR